MCCRWNGDAQTCPILAHRTAGKEGQTRIQKIRHKVPVSTCLRTKPVLHTESLRTSRKLIQESKNLKAFPLYPTGGSSISRAVLDSPSNRAHGNSAATLVCPRKVVKPEAVFLIPQEYRGADQVCTQAKTCLCGTLTPEAKGQDHKRQWHVSQKPPVQERVTTATSEQRSMVMGGLSLDLRTFSSLPCWCHRELI